MKAEGARSPRRPNADRELPIHFAITLLPVARTINADLEASGRQTASASFGRLAPRLRSTFGPSVTRPHSGHSALRPKRRGQGLAAPQRAAPCRSPPPPDAPQPALRPLLAWLPFVAACAGSLAGSATAQPAAPPHGAGLSRPPLPVVSVKARCRLPSQGRWSAIEHNARNYAQRETRCSLRRIICTMCKLPPVV